MNFLKKKLFFYQYLFISGISANHLSYPEFKKLFSLGEISTEKINPKTVNLSQTLQADIINGLELLLSVDADVADGFEKKIDEIYKVLVPSFQKSLKSNGRIFFVGSGSSGRVGIDLAAKSKKIYPEYSNNFEAIIAGGDSTFVRAEEGFEDSEVSGGLAFSKFNLNKLDTVVLISGSGSASFNVGCGNLAADLGAKVYYFYNSTEIPERTINLFKRKINPVIPLVLDIGPQAISGSTRLQASTLATLCLGSSLYLAHFENLNEIKDKYKNQLLNRIDKALNKIRAQLPEIKKVIEQEVKIFSDPFANFRSLNDFSEQGYVTFLASENCIREVFIDATETSPTFSTNPMKKEFEINKKKPEFQTYLIGIDDNKNAWEHLLARSIRIEDEKETLQFLLSKGPIGNNSYLNRPKGPGNIVFGVTKLNNNEFISDELIFSLKEAKSQGAITIVIIVSGHKLSNDQKILIQNISDNFILLEDLENDPFDIIQSISLKLILNLISNGSMILMNKVYGNRMIDLNPANYKLIDRSVRIINDIWNNNFQDKKIEDETLYNYINKLFQIKKLRQEQGLYTPSIINIILNLLYRNLTPDNFEEIISTMAKNNESLEFLNTNKRTI